jgi:hypothetical protein
VPKVLILGAGASYGHGASGQLRPPLAGGFFRNDVPSEIQRRYSELNSHIRSALGIDKRELQSLDIEQLYQALESAWWLAESPAKLLAATQDRLSAKFVEVVGLPALLTAYVHDVVTYTTQWVLHETNCPHHAAIAREWLKPGDTVINFNYDLLMDRALNGEEAARDVKLVHPHGCVLGKQLIWACANYPGADDSEYMRRCHLKAMDRTIKSGESQPNEAFDPIKEALQGVRQHLGVFNTSDARELDLAVRRYIKALDEKGTSPKEYREVFMEGLRIVPPSPYKHLEEVRRTWRGIAPAIARADQVVACGFSFRDSHFNEVFRQACRGRSKTLPLTTVTQDAVVLERTALEFHGQRIGVEQRPGWIADFMTVFRT